MLEKLIEWVDAKYGRSFEIKYSPYIHDNEIWIYDYILRVGSYIKDTNFPDDILETKAKEEKRKEYERLKAELEGSESNA